MKDPLRFCVAIAIALWVVSTGMCYFGIEHEISKIPPDVRAQMSDTDWVGGQWALRSVLVDIVGLLFVALGVAARLYQRWRGAAN